MLKAKQYNVNDSNVQGIGSDADKKARLEAAKGEDAWKDIGTQVGVQVWRIEKFNVKNVAKNNFGQLYAGDSYIILRTYKPKPDSEKLAWDVHFWLGKDTSQDEAGTAAYKTVELDDFLGGAPVQHREVHGHESELFLSYFKPSIQILEGGIDSGFNHAEPQKYKPRLIHVKGTRKTVCAREVPLAAESMNSGDVFILDLGLQIYQWNGSKSGIWEKQKGGEVLMQLDAQRSSLPKTTVVEEGSEPAEFWKIVGDKSKVKSAANGGADGQAQAFKPRLFQLSDETGKLTFTEMDTVSKSKLNANDVFILDTGSHIFTWIGHGANANEKKNAMNYALWYIDAFSRPKETCITRIIEGGESELFNAAF